MNIQLLTWGRICFRDCLEADKKQLVFSKCTLDFVKTILLEAIAEDERPGSRWLRLGDARVKHCKLMQTANKKVKRVESETL